ncbi:beta-carotene hydroxylase 2, chloroplastic-like isoform X2 [Tasmannia lanceolata]|uniref:beta-carotene hydroxylase 2, chloroplastic-like isoform X2 n=1 Tax=Tasmannia lanceolata TaxID=3420 RepID=UPI004064499C
MATRIFSSANFKGCSFGPNPLLSPKPKSFFAGECYIFFKSIQRTDGIFPMMRRGNNLNACFAMHNEKQVNLIEEEEEEEKNENLSSSTKQIMTVRVAERMARKKSERFTYLVAAIMSSFGISSMAIAAVYYRFSCQFEGGEIPVSEMFGTFALSVGAAVGMEFWARWAHRALWHASLWQMHEGLGITVFGMAYMFVHDGLVHRRFPVGPIANVPYLRRVAAAHQMHHLDKFNGVPYGLFLGPKELEEVGGIEELEKEISKRIKLSNSSSN